MAVLLDTTDLTRRERPDALITAMHDASGASEVTVEEDVPVRARLELWPFGAAAIFGAATSGVSMTRTAKAARSATAEHIAIGVQAAGVARFRIGSTTRVVPSGEALVVDVSRPFHYQWRGFGAAHSLNLPLDQLTLPAEQVRRAVTRLQHSPLYGLVSRHIRDLAANAEALSASPMAPALGAASIELARALIATAIDGTPGCRDVVEQTLLTQIRAYVRQHLGDPGLTPDGIARALAISPRHLYRVCATAGFRLEQWIITSRLANAKAELVDPRSRHRSLAAIARRWGFTDPTHFTRRFRAAYGLLPSEWRREGGS
ncbi:hypothetical protein BAY61_29580 [Prauserella marina]|uniref:AraC-type DNA-binding protein n=1 Tax=Prauserella marina TaxID=530584 RepID=A0A222VX21_9PSEU|nr:helix-turn-helix domain-containing protein [Prauserella marina]ASR38465.1 hypothetical protein BAY61_29580 [Prauserella marina]PWV78291.1 AraC-like DNA-binding protein [Prauserella marina]SDC82700.1 AraC-type DNA-binding protein [Prauserella marina]